MNTKGITLLASWLLFAGIIPIFGEGINGTWHLNSFHTEGNAYSPVPTISSFTGTVTIDTDAGTISFDTNQGNWTESNGFVQDGDTYQMAYSRDGGDHSLLMAIRVIDEDTLAIFWGAIWLDDSPIGKVVGTTDGMAGVLTKNPIPTSASSAWEGAYDYKGGVVRERSDGSPGLRLRRDSGLAEIVANDGDDSFRVTYDNELLASSLSPSGNMLTWQNNNTSDYLLLSNPTFDTRHVQSRDQVRAIQLDNGKVAVFLIYHQRTITKSENEWYDGIRQVSNFEYSTHILVPKPIGGYSEWVAAAELVGDDAEPGAAPFGDCVANLLKYAFNMDPAGPDSHRMTPGGNSGLPWGALVEEDGQMYWRVEFVRRKDSELTYTPQKSGTLEDGSFVPFTAEETVSDIPGEPDFERVIVDEPCDPATEPRFFTRVRVVID